MVNWDWAHCSALRRGWHVPLWAGKVLCDYNARDRSLWKVPFPQQWSWRPRCSLTQGPPGILQFQRQTEKLSPQEWPKTWCEMHKHVKASLGYTVSSCLQTKPNQKNWGCKSGLGWCPIPHEGGIVACTNNSRSWEGAGRSSELKFIIGYTVNSKIAWATWDPVPVRNFRTDFKSLQQQLWSEPQTLTIIMTMSTETCPFCMGDFRQINRLRHKLFKSLSSESNEQYIKMAGPIKTGILITEVTEIITFRNSWLKRIPAHCGKVQCHLN